MKRKIYIFVLTLMSMTTLLHAQEFDVSLLTHPEGVFQATAINDSSEIAGILVKPDTSFHAVLWKADSEFVSLTAPEGFNSTARALNNSGQLVGTISAPGSSINLAAIWENNNYTELALPPGVQNSNALGINNSGVVSGWYTDSTSQTHAAYWNANGERQDLPSLGGNFDFSTGINESGQIVGSSMDSAGVVHAVVWQTGTFQITDFGQLNGMYSEARGINATGQIVGYARNDEGSIFQAFVSKGDSLIALEALGGENSFAWGINDDGIIVGASAPAGTGTVSGKLNQFNIPYTPQTKIGILKATQQTLAATLWRENVETLLYEGSNLNNLLAKPLFGFLIDAIAVNAYQQIVAVTDSGQSALVKRAKSKLKITEVIIEGSQRLVANSQVEFTVVIANEGTGTAFSTELSVDGFNLEQIGDIPAGEKRIVKRNVWLGDDGKQTIHFKANSLDDVAQFEKDVFVEIDAMEAIIDVFVGKRASPRDDVSLKKVHSEKSVDIYVDSMLVIDNLPKHFSSGKETIPVNSTSPLMEIVDGTATNNNTPLASFYLNLLFSDSTFSKKNRIIFVETEDDSFKMYFHDTRFMASDPSKVDIQFFHADVVLPKLDISVSGENEELHPLDFSGYLELESTVQKITIGNEAGNIAPQDFQIDLSGVVGQVINVTILPDTSGQDSSGFWLAAYDTAGNSLDTQIVTEAENTTPIPGQFILQQNYPNPFNPKTTIQFEVPVRSDVRLTVFDILGRTVRTLINENKSAGSHSVVWNGRDDDGLQLASGIYVYRLEAGELTKSAKMLLLK